jgi:hypothetical protein
VSIGTAGKTASIFGEQLKKNFAMHNQQHLTGSGDSSPEQSSVHGGSGPTLAPGVSQKAMQTITEQLAEVLPTPPPVPTCRTCGQLHDLNEPCQSDAEFSKQVQREACSQEVWAADEIPFEVAERVIRKRMLEEMERLIAARDTYVPQIKLELIRFSSSEPRFKWVAQPMLLKASGEGDTLDEALVNMPKHKTAAEEKTEKIAALRAELATLESAKG